MAENKEVLQKFLLIAAEMDPKLKNKSKQIDDMTDEEAEKFLRGTLNVILDGLGTESLGEVFFL